MSTTLHEPMVSTPLRPQSSGICGIVEGEVKHRRNRPVANTFTYPAFCLRLPLSGLAQLPASGIALNRGGLVSFHERDHGPRDGSSLDRWMRQLLRESGVRADGEIELYCFPRMLGYVFNPVSFWVCRDTVGNVKAVLVEVNNTFGESHCYLLAHDNDRALVSGEVMSARKSFHVSPFCAVAGYYRFRFHFGPQRWLARIDFHDGEGTPLLETHIAGTGSALGRSAARHLLWRYRWYTAAVVGRIHWQALRLWIKRAPFFSKPAAPLHSITRSP